MIYHDIAKYYDKIFPFAEERISFLEKFLPKGETILDIGCATGKYTAKLNQEGYDVIGFDVDKEMLKVAKKNYFSSTFIQEDILHLEKFSVQFHSAFSLGNTMSYLTSEDRDRFIDELCARMPKGGIWVMQTINWDYVLRDTKFGFPDVYLDSVHDPAPLKFRRWYDNISREHVEFHRQMIEGRSLLSHAIDSLYPFTSTDAINAHQERNMQLICSAANYLGEPFNANKDSSCILVFQKK